MKICHITSAHNTNDGRIFLKECTSLAKKEEYEVYLVGQGVDRTENKVKVIGVGDMPSRRIKRMLGFSKKVIDKAMTLDADVYHIHDPELLRHALKLKRSGAAVIFDSHENVLDSIDEKAYLPKPIRILAKIIYTLVQGYVIPKIDAVIVVSPQMIKTYSEYNKNVVMVTNFPIISASSSDSIKAEKKGAIVFAGGVSRQWSLLEVLSAIQDIEGVHLYVYGKADKPYLELLEEADVNNNFTYGGILPFEEIQKKLSEAEMAVALLKPGKNSFYNEGTLGNTKLFEAMLNETPVVATNFTIWKDIVDTNMCGVCADPDNEKEIRNAITKIHNMSASDRMQMGKNGRNTVVQKYNWAIEEEKLFSLYRKIQERK